MVVDRDEKRREFGIIFQSVSWGREGNERILELADVDVR